ncbi:hypothetical protein PtB15_12B463 [Puccinia triticina]|nr:hypothetical protein PtB15_12B463 [Puccinia triticina]
MKRPADQSTTNSYPLVNDIYDTVPLPFTREIPLRPAQPLIPNSLRMIQSLVATASSFPNPIHKFTIPGQTLSEAEAFVIAMQTTIYWSKQRGPRPKPAPKPKSGRTGCPIKNHFRLDYICPWSGYHIAVPNSRKVHAVSRKCGCKSGFGIFHNVRTNTLWVEWRWEHNHDPFSPDEIKYNQSPWMVDNWLTERVIAGLSWKAIQVLAESQEIILYEQLDPKGKLQLFYGKWLTVSTSFVEYVQNQWDVNIIHWALAY